MELIATGFLLGVVFSIIMIGAGVLYADRMADGKHQNDIGGSVFSDGGDRDRSCAERNNKGVE